MTTKMCPTCKGEGRVGGYAPRWGEGDERVGELTCDECGGEGDYPVCEYCEDVRVDGPGEVCDDCHHDLMRDEAADNKYTGMIDEGCYV